ncbi:hypothetical protein PROFUN_04162 [Planoprotostelium fungivorum]|uniref:Protein kinase domain-containing protein n=1 Tax=Planoprotostelium fungivorum TaxID=1890364 RepID=A0A2P6NVS7_9EUKA|nr:hypothetical protein PROFUN_04162 [Planoprotostelium fungivorum]
MGHKPSKEKTERPESKNGKGSASNTPKTPHKPKFKPIIYGQTLSDIPSEYCKEITCQPDIDASAITGDNFTLLVRVLMGPPRTAEQLKADEEEFYKNCNKSNTAVMPSISAQDVTESTSKRSSMILSANEYQSESIPVPEAPVNSLLESSDTLERKLIVDPNIKKNLKQQKFQGSGGFGRVFKGYFPELPKEQRAVAIKKMKHMTEKEKRRNLNEIGHLERLKHENIVSYYRSYLEAGEVWMVMELMEGGTLGEASQIYDFTDAHIAYVAREMLKAIEYLHAQGLAHRDLKSSNVMLTVSGQVKLIDFGFCIQVKEGITHMVGSPFWMPPEMIQGKAHGCPVDIWSLAVSLLEMLQKKPPNRNSSVKAMYVAGSCGLLPILQQQRDKNKISKDLHCFLSGCLEMDPTRRATASQLLTHKFLDNAPDRSIMSTIISSVFVAQMLTSGGFV